MDLQTAKAAQSGVLPINLPAVFRPEISVIRAAQELIRDEKNWIHGSNARDDYGRNCAAHSGSAVAWCLFGALQAAWKSGAYLPSDFDRAVALVATATGRHSELGDNDTIFTFNDGGTHAQVMALCDRACV